MFNRSSDNDRNHDMTFLPVVLTLVSGERVKGAIAMRRNGRLGEVLNGPDQFLLFKTRNEEPVYLSRNSVAAVQSNQLPRSRQLHSALERLKNHDPYHILGVEHGVGREELRRVYHELVRKYHPDQFAETNLPDEVRSYLDTVILRLNGAYQQIMEDMAAAERARQQAAMSGQRQNQFGAIRYFGQH